MLVHVIRRQLRELTLHRVDPPDIGRDEMIAAALIGLHLEMTARESSRGTSAAEMDEGREILPLARTCLHVVGAGENGRDIAVEIDRCEGSCGRRSSESRNRYP